MGRLFSKDGIVELKINNNSRFIEAAVVIKRGYILLTIHISGFSIPEIRINDIKENSFSIGVEYFDIFHAFYNILIISGMLAFAGQVIY